MQPQTEVYLALILTTCIVLVFVIGIVLFIIQYRNRKVFYQTEKNTMERTFIEDISKAKIEMQLLTMQDIGREIHDGVGQRLTLASIYSKQLLSKELSAENQHSVSEISQIIHDSLIQLRELSRELADEKEHIVLINQLIKAEVEKVNALMVCTVTFEELNEGIYLENNKAKFIIRIMQEFMQNSLKYADCSMVTISISGNEHQIKLTINDNGKGFDISKVSGGMGLQNMKKRADMIQATYSLNSIPGKGTFLTLQL